MCYKHQCQARAVNNGVVNASTKLPASQLVVAFYYHALNYILGQIVTVCMASISGFRSQQEPLPLLSMLSPNFTLVPIQL